MFTIVPKVFYCALSALVFTVVTLPVRAATTTQVDLLTGIMIESQGDNLGLLSFMFGPDPSSTLDFSTNVASSGTSFSFSLNPGATYQGQSLSLMGSGEFNPSTGRLVTSSTGTLGNQSWTTSGSETVIRNEDNFSSTGDLNLSTSNSNPSIAAMVEAGGRVRTEEFLPDGTSTNSGYYKDKNGKKIPGSEFLSKNELNPDGKWEYKEEPGSVNAEGFSPPNGGTGSSTVSIVPEPTASLLFLGGLSVLWLVFVRRRFSGTRERSAI